VGLARPPRRRLRALHLGVRRRREHHGAVRRRGSGRAHGRGADFWTPFWPGLAANVGYRATLSLNVPDFTRFAQSQRSQAIGQAIGRFVERARFGDSLVGTAQ